MSSLLILAKTISLTQRMQFYFVVFVICISVYIILRSLQYFFDEDKRDKNNQKAERNNLVSLLVGLITFILHCNFLLNKIVQLQP